MFIFGCELILTVEHSLQVIAERTGLAEYHKAETNFVCANRMNPSYMDGCGSFHLDKIIIVGTRSIYQ